MRIGLLEDDQSQIELINMWTTESGDQLQSFTTGDEFREAVAKDAFDLLILDWHLPDTTGIDVLDWLRGDKASNLPVIFITNRDSKDSVVEALDHGADDYLVKPVNKEVTLARINALQRRYSINNNGSDPQAAKHPIDTSGGIDHFDPFVINADEQLFTVNGEAVKLTNKEFELASFLFRHAGSLVTRDYLLEHIWGKRADLNTRTVDTHISRIRSKLGISPANGWQLSSIYQRGYRLFRVTPE